MRMQLIKVVAAVLALSLAATVEQSPAVYGADRATEDRVRSLENQLEQLTKAMDRFEGGLERFRCKQNSKPDADANASPSVLSNSYVEQGLAEYRRGDFSAAWRCFTAAVKINPRCWRAYHNRGTLLLHAPRFDEVAARTIADLSTAIRLNPEFPDSFSNRGLAYEKTGDLERAEADYLAAQQLGMDCHSSLARLGVSATERDSHDPAATVGDEDSQHQPKNAEIEASKPSDQVSQALDEVHALRADYDRIKANNDRLKEEMASLRQEVASLHETQPSYAASAGPADTQLQVCGAVRQWASDRGRDGYKVLDLTGGSGTVRALNRDIPAGGLEGFYLPTNDGGQVYVQLWPDSRSRTICYVVH